MFAQDWLYFKIENCFFGFSVVGLRCLFRFGSKCFLPVGLGLFKFSLG